MPGLRPARSWAVATVGLHTPAGGRPMKFIADQDFSDELDAEEEEGLMEFL